VKSRWRFASAACFAKGCLELALCRIERDLLIAECERRGAEREEAQEDLAKIES
jgi:hypothetical protein